MAKYMNLHRNISIVFIILFLSVLLPKVYAETADELRQKITERNADIANLEKQILEYQKTLSTLSSQKNTLANSIKQLDITAKKLALDIKLTQNKINATNLTIQDLSQEIGTTNDSIFVNQDAIKKIVRSRNEIDSIPLVESLAGEFTLTNVWRTVDASLSVQEKLGGHVVALKDTKNVLEDKRTKMEKAQKDLLVLKNQLSSQKKIVDQNNKDKQKLLKDTKNQESNYNALLKISLARKIEFEKELFDFESKLKFVLDPKSFASPQQGTFSWPVDNIRITQFFGKTSVSGRLYASGTHGGVDFGVPIGTIIRAVGTGTVIATGDTDLTCPGASYGKWVFIKYDNGLATVYGHLSLPTAQNNMRVKSGDVVGYSGNTGHSTGPHLHVSMFVGSGISIQSFPSKTCGGRIYTMPVAAKAAYLDPMLYFPKYTGPTTSISQTD